MEDPDNQCAVLSLSILPVISYFLHVRVIISSIQQVADEAQQANKLELDGMFYKTRQPTFVKIECVKIKCVQIKM